MPDQPDSTPATAAGCGHPARFTDDGTCTECRTTAPLDDPAVQAIADALMTPHTLNFDTVYVADRLRAEVMAMHVSDVLELNHWEVRYVGPG